MTSNNYHKKNFYSRGKLLLTGEYAIMHGAWALALPLKPGQYFQVEKVNDGQNIIHWRSHIFEHQWFEGQFRRFNFETIKSNGLKKAHVIQKVLRSAKILNPEFLSDDGSYYIDTNIEFDLIWGLGSGSTMISNMAYWADCNPYELNKMVFNDVGYEIACARSKHPVHFRLHEDEPQVFRTEFKPYFRESIYFIFMNSKENMPYMEKNPLISPPSKVDIDKISEITCLITDAETLDDFIELLLEHERVVSRMIGQNTVGQTHFNGFKGVVKSLGTWGGDFVLAATKEPYDYVKSFFKSRGYGVIFRYNDLVSTGD